MNNQTMLIGMHKYLFIYYLLFIFLPILALFLYEFIYAFIYFLPSVCSSSSSSI